MHRVAKVISVSRERQEPVREIGGELDVACDDVVAKTRAQPGNAGSC